MGRMGPAMRDDDLLTIGQMCETFGVTPRTLRFYESRKLITPLRQGQLRLYSRRERGRLTLILRGRRFGFSLDEMGRLLDLYEPAGDNAAQLRATVDIARRRLAAIRLQHEELLDIIEDLEARVRATDEMLARSGAHSSDQPVKDEP